MSGQTIDGPDSFIRDTPRSKGGDPARSVGDFLLEIDETLRPLIDLSKLLGNHVKKPGSEPAVSYEYPHQNICHVSYKDPITMAQGKQRLQLLLNDGKDISISLGKWSVSLEEERSGPSLCVPKNLVVQIAEHLAVFTKERAAIAEKIEAGERDEAVAMRKALRSKLVDAGLIVDVPDAMVQRLVNAYDKLPMHNGALQPSRGNLLPLIEHFLEVHQRESFLKIESANQQKQEFVEALLAIADHVNTKRRNPSTTHISQDSGSKTYRISHFPFGFKQRMEKLLEERGDAVSLLTSDMTAATAPIDLRSIMPLNSTVPVFAPHHMTCAYMVNGQPVGMPAPETPAPVVTTMKLDDAARSLAAPVMPAAKER